MKSNNFNYKKLILQITLTVLILLLWELSLKSNSDSLIPSPSECAKAFIELFKDGIMLPDLTASLSRVLIGFAIALFVGLIFGFLLGFVPAIKQAVMGLFELLRPIPPIAWIPMAVALLGIGDASAWFVIFIGAFFPILTNTLLGIENLEKLHLEAAKVLGASKVKTFTGVILPSTLPSIFAGMRVGLGFAWMCVVAAEMFASRSGLGYMIQLNRQLFRLDRVVAGMIAIALVGFLMSRIMTILERFFLPWRKGYIAKDFFDTALSVKLQKPNKRNLLNGNTHSSIEQKESILDLWKPEKGFSLSVNNLTFGYEEDNIVLNGLNLNVKEGEIYCILGLSGCGKSTLLRLIAGLEKKNSGDIRFDNVELNGYREDVTMVFQDFSLFPWRNVKRNVQFAIEQRIKNRKEISTEVSQLLNLVDLEYKSNDYPHHLSGGQMQRVAFARGLATKPKLMLLDEPFSALDSHTRESLQEEMSNIFKRLGITIIMVTHDISEAIFMADRVAIMDTEKGTIKSETIISQPYPRHREFRNTPEFRDMIDILWNKMHPNN